ncbi:iron-containing alcohol dehydrogenase [Parasphaerochaeta coccoides]|nr:iron-containing alcohol dehydrogenase [Parasphaerochaeta coccoides]
MPWRKPVLLEGKNSLARLPGFIKSKNVTTLLIVTDKGIASLGLMDALLSGLEKENLSFFVYDGTVPNPTIDNVEEALRMYQDNHCEAIIAFGGGSPMDCAKAVGARIARPRKSIMQMKGVFHVRKSLPPFFAIPTTAGTGSEATLASVISNPQTHEKFQIDDTSLIPRYAVLDPLLTVGLPGNITATTGMDALAHAVEAYIGNSNTRETKMLSRKAVNLIFQNIEKAYAQGNDLEARENMLKASHYAGLAFTQAYVGYVHAIAHALGGTYGIPHGLAVATVLPHVLEFYGKSVHRRLAELADVSGIGSPTDSSGQKAAQFIETIKRLNKTMGIPEGFSVINPQDIPLMAKRAYAEANPFYPVPRILSKQELEMLFSIVRIQ